MHSSCYAPFQSETKRHRYRSATAIAFILCLSCGEETPPSTSDSIQPQASTSAQASETQPALSSEHLSSQAGTSKIPVESKAEPPKTKQATPVSPPIDALTAALENDDRDPQKQQQAAGMLRNATGADVTLHTEFEAIPNTKDPGSTSQFRPGTVVRTVPSPTLIREILDWTHHRHHGPPAVVEVALYDGTIGWVEAQAVLVGADVVDVAPDDTLNIRHQRDWTSDKIAEVGPNGRLFYSPIDRHEQVGMKGCKNEFIAVRTTDGVDGYASCVYFR